MNVWGNYPLEMLHGRRKLEPATFIATNWPLLCQIAELQKHPTLNVVVGLPMDSIDRGDTVAIYWDGITNQVIVNQTDLFIEVQAIQLAQTNVMGLLWGAPAAMIRAALFHHGEMADSQRLDISVAQKAQWPSQMIRIFEQILRRAGPERARHQADVLIIQSAVQCYIQNLDVDAEIDGQHIHDIIRTRPDSIDLELFKILER